MLCVVMLNEFFVLDDLYDLHMTYMTSMIYDIQYTICDTWYTMYNVWYSDI